MSARRLAIAEGLHLPLDWMALANVVYGARGSGKTTLGAVIAEEVTKARQRFCAIDLKGDWYGLKSTADGKGEGIPAVIFGGEHADVPLEPEAGAEVASIVAELEQSVILDFELMSKGKQLRFLGPFFERLYHVNRDPLLLELDEVQRYAPQKPMNPDASICLGAVEDIVKLGRKHGIGVVMFTQRGSGLNKEVSELADMLVAFRTPGPLDQDRIKDWLDANTTKAQRDQVMSQLAGLETGTAIFASGHPGLKLFQVADVRERETFDSSATPKIGQPKKEPRQLAKPDLVRLSERMAASIERAKQADPKELKRRIAELEKERRQQKPAPPAAAVKEVEKRVEIPVLKDGQLKRLEQVCSRMVQCGEVVITVGREITAALASMHRGGNGGTLVHGGTKRPSREPNPAVGATNPVHRGTNRPNREPATRAAPRELPSGFRPSRPQQGLLNALAWLETVNVLAPRRGQAALVAQVSSKSSGFEKNVSTLSSAGLIRYPGGGLLALTDDGRSIAALPDQAPTTEELQEAIYRRLSGPQEVLLRVLVTTYPEPLTREELAERAEVSAVSSGFEKNVSTLRSLGLLEYPGAGLVAAADVLFLEGR